MFARRKRLVATIIAIAAITIAYTSGFYKRFLGDGVAYNTLIGREEFDVRQEYGVPVLESNKYISLTHELQSEYLDLPVKTLRFRPCSLRHLEGGTLQVWFVFQSDRWICFKSCWYAEYVRF